MTVMRDNALPTSAVGLVATSSYRGLWHSAGSPGAAGHGASAFGRLASTFNWSAPKQAVGYTWNGHTALFVRAEGRAAAAVGFNPISYGWTGVLQTYHGVVASLTGGRAQAFTVPGCWYDDLAMIDDPTAISLELPVSLERAREFGQYITGLLGTAGVNEQTFEYTFMPADVETADRPFVAQCTSLASIVLCYFLYVWAKEDGNGDCRALADRLIAMANSQTSSERNLNQGKMMQFIEAYNAGR